MASRTEQEANNQAMKCVTWMQRCTGRVTQKLRFGANMRRGNTDKKDHDAWSKTSSDDCEEFLPFFLDDPLPVAFLDNPLQ